MDQCFFTYLCCITDPAVQSAPSQAQVLGNPPVGHPLLKALALHLFLMERLQRPPRSYAAQLLLTPLMGCVWQQ